MNEQFFIDLAIKVAGALLGFVVVLISVLWRQLNQKLDKLEQSAQRRFDKSDQETQLRLRTLGHEDRAIRSQIHDLLLLFAEHESITSENKKLKWMLSESAKMDKAES